MDAPFLSKTVAILSAFASLNFRPSRVVSSRVLYPAAREACVRFVTAADVPIVLRAHPTIPDDLVIVFDSKGSFEIFRMEEE